jgi:hypothetical protein
MSAESHTVEARVVKRSIREGKQPSVLVNVPTLGEMWLTQSLPQYFAGTGVEHLKDGDPVRITYKGTFLSMCEKLEPFEATPADLPPDPNEADEPRPWLGRDATDRSIEKQVAMKCATELMVALIEKGQYAAAPGDVAATTAAMAASLWAAIEAE